MPQYIAVWNTFLDKWLVINRHTRLAHSFWDTLKKARQTCNLLNNVTSIKEKHND